MIDITTLTDLELALHISDLAQQHVSVLCEARRMYHVTSDWDQPGFDESEGSYDDQLDAIEYQLLVARREVQARSSLSAQ